MQSKPAWRFIYGILVGGLRPFVHRNVCQFGQNAAADQMKSPSTYTLFPYNPLLIPIAVICKHFKYARECGNRKPAGISAPQKFHNPFPFQSSCGWGRISEGQSGIKDSPGVRIKGWERSIHIHSFNICIFAVSAGMPKTIYKSTSKWMSINYSYVEVQQEARCTALSLTIPAASIHAPISAVGAISFRFRGLPIGPEVKFRGERRRMFERWKLRLSSD